MNHYKAILDVKLLVRAAVALTLSNTVFYSVMFANDVFKGTPKCEFSLVSEPTPTELNSIQDLFSNFNPTFKSSLGLNRIAPTYEEAMTIKRLASKQNTSINKIFMEHTQVLKILSEEWQGQANRKIILKIQEEALNQGISASLLSRDLLSLKEIMRKNDSSPSIDYCIQLSRYKKAKELQSLGIADIWNVVFNGVSKLENQFEKWTTNTEESIQISTFIFNHVVDTKYESSAIAMAKRILKLNLLFGTRKSRSTNDQENTWASKKARQETIEQFTKELGELELYARNKNITPENLHTEYELFIKNKGPELLAAKNSLTELRASVIEKKSKSDEIAYQEKLLETNPIRLFINSLNKK